MPGAVHVRGGKITLDIMNYLLKNRRYMGEYSYRDVVKEDGIPTIVPKELFERVQERLAEVEGSDLSVLGAGDIKGRRSRILVKIQGLRLSFLSWPFRACNSKTETRKLKTAEPYRNCGIPGGR